MTINDANIKQFEELINCQLIPSQDAYTIGVTRRGEITEYVHQIMNKWVQQFPSMQYIGSLEALHKQKLLAHRFCTYKEFEQLFIPSKNSLFDAVIFTLLGITDEHTRQRYTNILPRSMDGYFALMENVNAPLQTFFFEERCYGKDTRDRKAKAHLYSRWHWVG